MKKLLMLLFALASVAMLSSCNKDDDGGPSSVFKVTIDGDDFNFSEIEGMFDPDDDDNIYIVAFDEDEENGAYIDFYMDDVDDTGSYDIEDGDFSLGFFIDEEEVYYAYEGEVDVTSISESRFEATFEGVAYEYSTGDEVDFEDGQVKASLENID